MKIAFSTLGCPDFSWSDIYSMAKDLGFDGIEVRALDDGIYFDKFQPFAEGQLEQTIKKLGDLRLEIPCISLGCCLKYADREQENYQTIIKYIDLANKLGTPYIR